MGGLLTTAAVAETMSLTGGAAAASASAGATASLGAAGTAIGEATRVARVVHDRGGDVHDHGARGAARGDRRGDRGDGELRGDEAVAGERRERGAELAAWDVVRRHERRR